MRKQTLNMKRYIPLIILAFVSLPIQAQTDTFTMQPESPSIIARLSLVSPKLVGEIAPSDFFTLTAGFWLHTSFWATNNNDERYYSPSISPSFTFEPRYYFNLADRHAKGKRTDYYSGWFIALPFSIRFPDLRYTLGGTIGFQRTLGKRWYWNFSVGPGFNYYDSRFHFEGAGDVGLGIILNRM